MTHASTTATKVPCPPSISTSFGSIGPLQGQLRLFLGCSSHADNDQGAAVAFAHDGLPKPGRDLECQHFVLDCDAPLLVLATKHHDSCFYVVVNLADTASRQAFSKAYGFSGLELVMVDSVSRASSYMLAVSHESSKSLREVLAGHEAFLRDDRLWLLRLGEVISGLPREFARHHADAASSLRHHVLVLFGDRDSHFVGVRDALRRVLGKYE